MKYILLIIFIVFIGVATGNVRSVINYPIPNNCDTVPTGVPQLFGGKYYKFNGYVLADSLLMTSADDTVRPVRYPALKFKNSDKRWYNWDMTRWQKALWPDDTISLSNRINSVSPTLQQVINNGNHITDANDSIVINDGNTFTIHAGTGASGANLILKALQSSVSHSRIVMFPSVLGLEYRDLGTGNIKSYTIGAATGITVTDQVNATGMGYGGNYRINGLANFGARWIPDWGTVRDSIAANVPSLTATYVGYGSASNILTGSNGLTWDNTNRVLQIMATPTEPNGADFDFYLNNPSPAINDRLNEIHAYGNNSSGTKTQFTALFSEASNVTAGSEAGRLLANVASAGLNVEVFRADGNVAGQKVVEWNRSNADFDFRIGAAGSNTNPFFVEGSSSRVGIGTITPGNALQVHNSLNGQHSAIVSNPNTGSSAYSSVEVTDDPAGGFSNGLRLVKLGANFSTNGAYMSDAAVVAAANNVTNGLNLGAFNTAGVIRFYTGNFDAANERMRLNAAGKLLVNSTSDQGAFTIQNTGGLFQNGTVHLRGQTAPSTSYTVLVKGTDSLVYQQTESNLGRRLNFSNTGDSLIFVGDSYTTGQGSTTGKSASFLTSAANGKYLYQKGAGGTGAKVASVNINATLPGYNNFMGIRGAFGFNDLRRGGNNPKTFNKIKNCWYSIVASSYLSEVAIPASSATTGGTWTSADLSSVGAKSNRMGGLARFAQSTGATLSWTFTGNNLVISTVAFDGTLITGGIFEVSIDGIPIDTVDVNGETDGISDEITNNAQCMMAKIYWDLAYTSHTVQVRTLNSSTVWIDYFGVLNGTTHCAPILASLVPKMKSTSYAIGAGTTPPTNLGSPTIFNSGDSVIKIVVFEFRDRRYPIDAVPVNDFFNPEDPDQLDSDELHPSDTGYYQIFLADQSLLQPYTYTGMPIKNQESVLNMAYDRQLRFGRVIPRMGTDFGGMGYLPGRNIPYFYLTNPTGPDGAQSLDLFVDEDGDAFMRRFNLDPNTFENYFSMYGGTGSTVIDSIVTDARTLKVHMLHSDSTVTLRNVKGPTGAYTVLAHDADSAVKQVSVSALLSGADVMSATYTPTLTGVTNVASVSLGKAQYSRIGNMVTVYINLSIDPTGLGTTEVGISLPIASVIASGDIIGLGTCSSIAAQTVVVAADTGNSRGNLAFTATDINAQAFYVTFSYMITPP